MYSTCVSSKGRVQKPQARKLSVGGGVPPPRGLHGRDFSEKLTEKGGTPPPPITDDSLPKTDFFPPKTAFFAQKHCFWANFKWIFS